MNSTELKIDTPESLRAAILQLQQKQISDGNLVKKQFKLTFESITPLNLIKGAVKGAAQSTGISSLFSNEVPSDSNGLASNKAPQFSLKSTIGTILLLGITGAVAKKSMVLASLGHGLAQLIMNRQTNKSKELTDQNGSHDRITQ
jgi:hypothetical protein